MATNIKDQVTDLTVKYENLKTNDTFVWDGILLVRTAKGVFCITTSSNVLEPAKTLTGKKLILVDIEIIITRPKK